MTRTYILVAATAVALALGAIGTASAAITPGSLMVDANATLKPNAAPSS